MPKYTKPLSYVRDYPGEGETIVLLHGFLASKSYWSKPIPTLQNGNRRIIAIDLLGFGKSPKPSSSAYSYSDHLEHISATLRALSVTSDITLIGHSMGALLAVRYAEAFPDKVSTVNLLNPPMYTSSDQAHHALRATSHLYAVLLDSRFRHLLWGILQKFSPLANHSRRSREGSLKNVIMPATFFHDLRRISHPTLLVIGRNDRAVYLDNLRDTTLRSNVTLHIEESGHHSPLTHPLSIGQHILNLT